MNENNLNTVIQALNNLVDIARVKDAWKKFQVTGEPKAVVIDRFDNAIYSHLNEQREQNKALQARVAELEAALHSIINDEHDGYDHCKYCYGEDIGIGKDDEGHELILDRSDFEQSQRITEFRLKHEEWCPSVIADAALKQEQTS